MIELLKEFKTHFNPKYYPKKVKYIDKMIDLLEALNKKSLDIGNLEEVIKGIKYGKANIIEVYLEFIAFLEEKGIKPNNEIKTIPYEKTERLIELIKYLHQPRTMRELQDHFVMSEKQLRRDLSALRDGKDLLGWEVQLNYVNSNGKRLSVTKLKDELIFISAHPIFMTLNLTELYNSTIRILDVLEPRSIEYQNHLRYVNKLLPQLSPYALEFLFGANQKEHDIELLGNSEFEEEGAFYLDNKYAILGYLTKRSMSGYNDVAYIQYKKDKIVSMRLILRESNGDNFVFENLDGELKTLDIDQILTIEII
jgi:hypothetical protein